MRLVVVLQYRQKMATTTLCRSHKDKSKQVDEGLEDAFVEEVIQW
jgi:hypothetical protein